MAASPLLVEKWEAIGTSNGRPSGDWKDQTPPAVVASNAIRR